MRIIDAMPPKEAGPQLLNAFRKAHGHLARFLNARIAELRVGDLAEAAVWLSDEDVDVRKRAFTLAFLPVAFGGSDAQRMRELAASVDDAFPDLSRTEQSSGLMSKREVTVCGFCDGRIEGEYCTRCSRDPRGFFSSEMPPDEIRLHLERRADALDSLLGN